LYGCAQPQSDSATEPQPSPSVEPGPTIDHSVGLVYALTDDNYIQMLTEFSSHLPDYQGASLNLTGEVHAYGDEYPDLPITFAVMRTYMLNGEEGFVALDCYYEGEPPAMGSWVNVEGALHSYTLLEDGEEYAVPLLMVQSLEVVEERPPLAVTAADFEHSHE
jgi:uncharacterized membrane protein YcgQ (UPF0703/DUF1980 family)